MELSISERESSGLVNVVSSLEISLAHWNWLYDGRDDGRYDGFGKG